MRGVPRRYQVLTLQQVDARLLFVNGRMSSTEKEIYKIFQFSGKQKDYYCCSRLFLVYAVTRKYKEVLTGDTTIPDQDDLAVKRETDDAVKAEYADIPAKSRKAMLELLAGVENRSVYFLQDSHARNAKKCA